MATKRTLIGNIKGPQGVQGETGEQGVPGEAATIEVGTVSTTAYGNTAQVINSGTENAAVFDFVIPQGRPGEETTRMSALTLDTVTAQSASYPVPATGESGATVFGKIIKFFNDVKSALTNKINYSDCVKVLTNTSDTLPLAASQGKALNDALTNKMKGFAGFENVTISAGSKSVAAGLNSVEFTFSHQLSKTPSRLMVFMFQSTLIYVASFGLTTTGGTIRFYNVGSTFTTNLTFSALAMYDN